MRSEKEMLDLIINTANEDPRIRAAYLEGSRVNPTVQADIFQDYDVVYVVEETKTFREDPSWIGPFRESVFTCSIRRTVPISLLTWKTVTGG